MTGPLRGQPAALPDPGASARAGQRRDLRSMLGDGIAFSAMVGLGETYLPAFVLAAGLGALSAGLVTTLPMLAGACLQLTSPFALRRLGSYRRWVVLCARLQALSFAPLVAGALTGWMPVEWVFFVAAWYWGFGLATSPAWNAWVGSLVPLARRPRFFATRNRLSQLSLFLAVLAGGAFLDLGSGRGWPLATFGALFASAAVARLVSSAFLARQSERPGLAADHRRLPVREVIDHLRHGGESRLLLYLLAMQLSVHLAAPFFTPFMLGPLELTYLEFTLLTATAFLSRIATLPALGRLAQERGTSRTLWFGAVGIVPLPVLWLVSDDFLYLLGVQVIAGAVWAALELAGLLSVFEVIDERDRASVLTWFNLANAAALTAGSLLGGLLFTLAGTERGPYVAVFAASCLTRGASLLLLRRAPTPEIVAEPVALRTLAVRPSLGAVQRPILPSLPEETIESGAAPDRAAP